MSAKPEALRLAEQLEAIGLHGPVAAELRRLHAQRDALLEALRHAAAWFDAADPVDTGACHVRAVIKAVEGEQR